MAEDRLRTWNGDKPWSEMDLFDLQNNIARGDLVEETAEFLMRREDEVREKIRQLRTRARKSPVDERGRVFEPGSLLDIGPASRLRPRPWPSA
jgi:hypothetical protein